MDKSIIKRLRSREKMSNISKLNILLKDRLVFKNRRFDKSKSLLSAEIINRYRLSLTQELDRNFQFLEFLFPKGKGSGYKLNTNMNNSVRYITRDLLKKIVSNLYITQDLIKENPQLKALIQVRAELLFKDRVSFENKKIEKVLLKEIQELSILKPKDIEKRVEYFSTLNSKLEKVILKENRGDIKFDIEKFMHFNTKESRALMKSFSENNKQKNDDKLMKTLLSKISITEVKTKNETKLEKQFITQVQAQESEKLSKSIYQGLKRLFPLMQEDTQIYKVFQKQFDTIFSDKSLSSSEVLSESIKIKESFVEHVMHRYDSYVSEQSEKEIQGSLLKILLKQVGGTQGSAKMHQEMQKQVNVFVRNYKGTKDLGNYHLFLEEMSKIHSSSTQTKESIVEKVQKYVSVKEGLEERLVIQNRHHVKQTLNTIIQEYFLDQNSYSLLSRSQKTGISTRIEKLLEQRDNEKAISLVEIESLKLELQKISIPTGKKTTQNILQELSVKESSFEMKEIETSLQSLKILHEKELSHAMYQELIAKEKSGYISSKRKQLLLNSVSTMMKSHADDGVTLDKALTKIKNTLFKSDLQLSHKNETNFQLQNAQRFYLHFVKEVQEHTPYMKLSFIEKKMVLKKINNILKYQDPLIREKAFSKLTQEYIVLENSSAELSKAKRVPRETEDVKASEVYTKLPLSEKSKLETMLQSRFLKGVKKEKIFDNRDMRHLTQESQKNKINTSVQTRFHSEFLKGIKKEKILEHIQMTHLTQDSQKSKVNSALSHEELLLIQGSKSFEDELQSSEAKTVFVGDQRKKSEAKEKEAALYTQSIMYEVEQQKEQVSKNVSAMHEDLDDRLDEIALKIFKDIKDEINLEYKRL